MVLVDELNTRGVAEGASSDVDTGHAKRNTIRHSTFLTSELASASTKSIDASGPIEKDGVEKPALELGPCNQHSVTSTPAQAQALPQTLESSTLLQDQTNQQSIEVVTQSISVESSNSCNNGWTDENMAELENELRLALEEEQVGSSSAGTPTSLSTHSVETSQNETRSGEGTQAIVGRPEELQDSSQYDMAHGLEWEQEETKVPIEGIMQQQDELGHLAIDDQQDLVEVVNADNFEDMEAIEALPAAQPKHPEIDEHRYRLRGIRFQRLAKSQIQTTQYQVVWGKYPNKSKVWVNKDDLQMSIPWPPCKLDCQDLTLQPETDIFKICKMRSDRRTAKKRFEYLVEACGLDGYTWITEDQLKISYYPVPKAQRDVLLRHSATPIYDEQQHNLQASRGFSAPADLALGGEPETWKQGHQGRYIEISSEIDNSVNTDNNYNTYDTADEDPRPAKRRRSHIAPAMTSPLYLDDDQNSKEENNKEDNWMLGTSIAAKLTNSCGTTLVSDLTSLTELQLCPVVTDDQDWEVRGIVGKENVNGISHYWVDWKPTLLPKHSLGHAKELVDNYEAHIRALTNDRGGSGSKRSEKANVEAKGITGRQGMKPRGRPRKQT